MFETLKTRPADSILMLMQMFRDDPRDTKIDLGVGVYKDASGRTPVMRAVKAAEHTSSCESAVLMMAASTTEPPVGAST